MITMRAREKELVRTMLHALVRYDRKGSISSVTRTVPGWLCGVLHLLWMRTDYVVCVAPQTYALTRAGFGFLFPDVAEPPAELFREVDIRGHEVNSGEA